jgi:acetyl esterase
MTTTTFTQFSIPSSTGPIGARIYAPTGTRAAEPDVPVPALVWIHGGGFTGGDLDMPEAHWVAQSLAERGHPVVTIDYRLVTETVRYPAPSDDVLTAWAWVLDHRSTLNITATVHLGGASAGGNLVAGAAMRLRDGDPVARGAEPPATVILAYPTLHAVQPDPSDELSALLLTLPEASRKRPEYVTAMYAKFLPDPGDDLSLAAAIPGDADPSGLPPTLIAGSEADMLRASAEGFVASLAAHGVEHEYFVEPATQHGHLNRPEEAAATATIDRFHSWLNHHGGRRRT